VADWSDGVSASCTVGPIFPLARAMDGHIMRCGTIGSCQSAASSEIVKALLVTSLTHVSGAITSVVTFTFTFTCYRRRDICNRTEKKTATTSILTYVLVINQHSIVEEAVVE